MRFDGQTYEPALDKERLTSQLERVWEYMKGGEWRTLAEIAQAVEGSEAGVSARLRDLRKERFGAHGLDRRRVAGGLFQYKLRINHESLFNPGMLGAQREEHQPQRTDHRDLEGDGPGPRPHVQPPPG